MSFSVPVTRVTDVSDHPNADKLEIVSVECLDGQICSPIGKFEKGDKVVHIPEDSLVPEWLQKELGVKGYLAGPDENRVKVIRLRGVPSFGLLYDCPNDWEIGEDKQKELGIKKWIPNTPASMNGEEYSTHRRNAVKYKMQKFRHDPNFIPDGTKVVVTEKCHGTFCQIGFLSEDNKHENKSNLAVTSKGRAKKRKLLKKGSGNVYWEAARKLPTDELREEFSQQFFLLGEVFGSGIQDLDYGVNTSKDGVSFRAFDIYLGEYGRGEYLPFSRVETVCDKYGILTVPKLWVGGYDKDKVKDLAKGKETISGDKRHIREGVVVRPYEKEMRIYGDRAIVKLKSDDYLARNDGTERH